MKIFIYTFVLLATVVLVVHFFTQINFRPMPKLLCEGQFDLNKPNWVSSHVDASDSHYVKPLQIKDLQSLGALIQKNIPGITVVQDDRAQLIAYRQSRLFNFVDWFCITGDGSVTSTATMGHSDFGKNRELVEQIRILIKRSD